MNARAIDQQARPSLLLVDDVEANLVALEAQLASMNCDLVRASSGNEALRQLLKREYAAILLDVQMPMMDGYEVATLARENPATRDVPIIFLTAMIETEQSKLRGYGTGAVDILFKPINPYILRSKVQVFLELHSNRRRLEAEIAAHKNTLEELEAFNFSISHDLRAPLRPLAGFSQILLEDYGSKLDEKGKDYLIRIRSAAERMSQLIEDLLGLSRVGRAEVRLQQTDLGAMAQSIMAELARGEPNRQVDFVAPPKLLAECDPRLMRIALENVLRNAWKFSQKNPTARIEFGKRNDGAEAAYFVKDNGVGFAPNLAEKLFKPFQRAHTVAEFEGTGIGLAIVDRILRHHHGKVWIETQEGAGTSVLFTLQKSRD